jgi:hypothetical protein
VAEKQFFSEKAQWEVGLEFTPFKERNDYFLKTCWPVDGIIEDEEEKEYKKEEENNNKDSKRKSNNSQKSVKGKKGIISQKGNKAPKVLNNLNTVTSTSNKSI